MSPKVQTGRYEIIETLGCGATSRVDKARDMIIGRTVAVKSFLQGFGRNSEQQFLSEAQTIGQLSHGSIAQLYDIGTDTGGAPFLVMEFVSGQNLEQLLGHSRISFTTAAIWAADLASALSCAHRAGIIHGDVKPSNIRVTEDDKVKLVDFGIARFASQVTGSDRVLGTPAYLSPEQIEGKKQDGRSDLFSLGVVLYEMITGVRPFTGDSLGDICAQILTATPIPPTRLNPAAPAAFDRIIERCLAKNPEGRYQSGNDLARALYLVARCGNKLTSEPKKSYWFLRPAHPRDLLAIASAVLLLMGALVAGGSVRDWFRAQSTPSIDAVQSKPQADLTLPTQTRTLANPEEAVPAKSAAMNALKPAKKATAHRHDAAPAVRQASEASSPAPLTDPAPIN
jgi:serine/threonine protein kinase